MDIAFSGKTWFITGCSSGFGKSFVPAILKRGDKVIATARDVSSLAEYHGHDRVRVMQLDVTASQDVLNTKIAEAMSFSDSIDVLVNNAGFVSPGVWEEVTQYKQMFSHESAMRQFSTNFFGPMNLTRAILPHFRSRKSGTLIFMSSIAAWHGAAAGGLYSSSKFALEGAVESLSREILPLGIRTHLIVLGQFRTSILNPSRLQSSTSTTVKDYEAIRGEVSTRHTSTNERQIGDPALAVERIIDLVEQKGVFAELDKLPLRVLLGSDAVEVVRTKCLETLAIVSDMEAVSQSTDFPDAESVPSYWDAPK